MASDRIEYGIDLGTTNSAISYLRRGQPTIVKNRLQADTTPSAVSFRKGKVHQVGTPAYNRLQLDRLESLRRESEQRNVFVEFKRTMGTDQTFVPSGDHFAQLTSELLSAEVLKHLRSLVTDREVNAAVVTIPSAFIVPQQQATLRAAELAGLRQCLLLQEPVAAVMAYGIAESKQPNGKWLVFDFGGGTFDVALAVLEDGQITVKDTEGDNHLGGKDLDQAVVEEIIVPRLAWDSTIRDYIEAGTPRGRRLRAALKRWAEQANIHLSFEDPWISDLDEIELADGRRVELDFEVTREELRPVVTPIFQRAIDKTKILLARQQLSASDLTELILVGGPTYSPILREMLTDQIRQPNTTVDPMTVVARGASVYAGTVRLDRAILETAPLRHTRGPSVLRLEVGYEATSIALEEFVTVKCLNPSDLNSLGALMIELHRTGWRSGKEPLSKNGALLEPKLESNCPNVFNLVVTTVRGDRVPTTPSEITIIQGTKVTGSPLPRDLGIEVWNDVKQKRVFEPLKGAEKSKPLPVTGVNRSLSTDSAVRPGVPDDRILIRIYEGESDGKGAPSALCDHVLSLELTGEQVMREIPAGTTFELTLVTEESSSVPKRVQLLFPTLDADEYELPIPSLRHDSQMEWVEDECRDAQKNISLMKTVGQEGHLELDDIEQRIEEFRQLLAHSGTDIDERNKASNRLKEVLRRLYQLVDKNAWHLAEEELNEAWTSLKRANLEEGYNESRQEIRECRNRLLNVKNSRNADSARELIEQFRYLTFRLKRCEWSREILIWAQSEFDRIRWKNSHRARAAVDTGHQALLANRPCSELVHHTGNVVRLLVLDSEDGPRPPVPFLDTSR